MTTSTANASRENPVVVNDQPPIAGSKRKRGPTRGIKRPEKPDDRVRVTIVDDVTFIPPSAISKNLALIKSRYATFRKNWDMWPKEEVDAIWGIYLKYFQFSSEEEERKGRLVWELIVKANYPNYMYGWKRAAIKKHGTIAAARNHKPGWTKLDVWEKLCDYWMSDEFLAASSRSKVNRAFAVCHPHSSGSTPFAVRTMNQTRALGRRPSWYEAYKETHTRKKKDTGEIEWVSEEAMNQLEEYETFLRKKHADYKSPVQELTDPGLEIWKIVVGGVKKGKLLGRPKEKWSSRSTSLSSPQFQSQESATDMQKLKEELETSKKREANRDLYITSLYDHVRKMSEMLQMDPPAAPPTWEESNTLSNSESTTPVIDSDGEEIDLT